jgi:hypothetical protein
MRAGVPIASDEPVVRLPALQRTHGDTGLGTGPLQPRAGAVSRVDVLGQDGAVFEADHSA